MTGSVSVQADPRNAVPGEVREHVRTGLLAETSGERRIVEDALDLRTQRRCITRRHEDAGLTIHDQLGHPTDSRTDDRCGTGHRFQQD